MQSSGSPSKFQLPWANSATSSYTRTIPVASQIGIQNGAASLTDGFPPLNFLPVGSGGIPPFGQDMNGILNQTTANLQWLNAGGLFAYDGTFSTSIGGYPAGAMLKSASTVGLFWLNTADNNTTNPESGGANWTAVSTIHGRQISTSSGTFTTPSGVYKFRARLWGTGGGGGGSIIGAPAVGKPGYGGGGCGYTDKIISTTPGTTYTITLGVGGTAGASSGGNGGAGGASSFGAILSVTGAGGGQGGSVTWASRLVGAGGVGSGGDLNLTGGAGGGSGTTTEGAVNTGGPGGAGAMGAGPATTINTGSFGIDGVYPGGGGGGAGTGANYAGGAGSAGLCIVEW
ncbi:glycine-rich domain-containing protein [Rhizobium rhizogenes]|uniref:glycine-rich domain-containing protein n=1 Tax=Rhizobium rhizogenes TaxID=359 RepID=UPI001574D68E|nr:hypothetical protein [Rhizobium rhizogenes]NTG07273.1 hypothetical protein [Rhizobium rhizogenes]